MSDNKIYLNFLGFDIDKDEFLIYRKKAENNESEAEYFAKLPINESNGKYANYQINLEPKQDFSEYLLHIEANIHLTKKIIFNFLHEEIKRVESDVKLIKGFTDGIELIVKKFPEGDRLVSLIPYFLKERRLFGCLINQRFSDNKDNNNRTRKMRLQLQTDNNGRSNKNYYLEKLNIINTVIQKQYSFGIKGVSFKLSKKLTPLNAFSLSKKKYIFNNLKIGYSQFQGLRNYGPYTPIGESAQIKYFFLFKEEHKKLANNIYSALSGRSFPGTFPGLEQMFGIPIKKEDLVRINLPDTSIDSVRNAVYEMESKIDDSITPIAIYIEDNSRDEIQRQVYSYLKLLMLQKAIPLQVVTNEKIGSTNGLKWSSSSIGLQIFSKLGGKPWIVKPSEENCLILGIGQAYEKGDDNSIKKHVAYTVCVDSSGLFKKVAILSSNDIDNNDFYSLIKSNIKSLLQTDEFKNYKKCAIHIPFTIKYEAVKVIESAAKDLMNDIEIRVIKVNRRNKFFGYSNHATRIPYESNYIRLGNGEYLVWFEGLNYGKEIVYKKVGNPVHIYFMKVGDRNEESDMSYLQDILNLSGANWRGFNAKSIPISIYYSELIAEYCKEFKQFPDFLDESLSQKFPWFL